MSTVASIRFRDTLPMDSADVESLYTFNLNRLTQFGSRILLIIDNFDAQNYDRTFTELLSQGTAELNNAKLLSKSKADLTGSPLPSQSAAETANAEVLEDLMRAGIRLLFTTRTSVPPQYASLCLSDAEHEMTLSTLLTLSKTIYTDCLWTEYDEVLMSRIILTVGKHVMLVELLCAALQQQSGFSSLEEMLEKLLTMELPQIEGNVTSRRSASAESSVYELMRRIFRFSSYEDPVRHMIRRLSLLSPLGMDREPFFQLIGYDDEKDVKRTLLRLRNLHLVMIDPRTAHISMHPVLADVAAADLNPNVHNCGVMITNAVQFFDDDSAVRYDARHLEQVSAMCRRCAMLLHSQESETKSAGSNAPPVRSGIPSEGSGVPSADAEIPCAVTEIPPMTTRLSLAISEIEYKLGNYGTAAFWAEHGMKEPENRSSDSSGPDDASSVFVKYRAKLLNSAARAYDRLGLFNKACAYYEEELELLPAEMKPDISFALNDYGVLLEEMGRCEEALDCLLQAWEIQKDLFGSDSPETISTCNNLGLICSDREDYEAAEMFYRHALRIALDYYKDGHPETATMYANLGELLMHSYACDEDEKDEGGAFTEPRYAESRRYLTKALEINTNAYGPSYPDNACTLNNLGILEDMERNHEKARGHFRKALEIQFAVAGSESPLCADILHNLAASYIDEVKEAFSSEEAFSAASADQKKDVLPLLHKALTYDRKAFSILEAAFDSSYSSIELMKGEIEWLESRLYPG